MPLTLSDADEQRIANELFFLKSPSSPLPIPANTTDANSLAAKLNPIAADPRFSDIGIGVVDFTSGVTTPKVWLHNERVSWRTGSTGKIAILLGAIQLRDDVRKVKATGLISSAADFDALFATIWKRSTDTKIQEIADPQGSPRISTIFDLTKAPINFIGADVPLNRAKLSAIEHLSWFGVPDLTFWERMWLMGALSDNVASCSCASEIGIAYIKAVQRAYKLFDPSNGMHMLVSSGYDTPNAKIPVNRSAGAPKFRALRNQEHHHLVKDLYPGTGNRSNQPGSVSALTAYMIALMQNKLAGTDGCDTLRTHLAGESGPTTSLILEGVFEVTTGGVTKAHIKLGILESLLRCEFAYIEADGLKYAVLGMGILPKRVGPTYTREDQLGRDLGKAVHTALLTAPTITIQSASQTVRAGQTATFSVVASGSGTLAYQWQKNGVNITGGATSASYTTPATTLADNGASFRCIVRNSVGSTASNSAILTLTP